MEKEKIIIWGTGKRSQKASRLIDENDTEIVAYVDGNKEKGNVKFNQKIVISPEEIKEYEFDKLVIFSVSFREIYKRAVEILHIQSDKIDNTFYFNKKEIMNYYKGETTLTEDKKVILEYLENYPMQVFNYDFANKYEDIDIFPQYDIEKHLFYVVHKNKKMYFKKSFTNEEKVKEYYKSLLIEQDENSPHRYVSTQLVEICEGAVVVDAGVAEGNFALDIIDKAGKIYLIESDPEWIEALTYTFEPYKEKVEIINKFLCKEDTENSITLNTLFSDEKIDVIKMDIEGYEYEALCGADKVLDNNEDIRLLICVYHNTDDEEKITEELRKYKIMCEVNKGFMVFLNGDNYLDTNHPLRLVHGILKAYKK